MPKVARLVTKVESTTFPQATYYGRDGEVKYSVLVGANLTPECIEIYEMRKRAVVRYGSPQHQRQISRTVTMYEEDLTQEIPWAETNADFETTRQLRTGALKKAVATILSDHLPYTFV